MDPFLLHLRILSRILEKKSQTLAQILAITENQQALLSAGTRDGDILRIYAGMAVEKRKLIDTVKESDKVFENTYREISPVFETEAPKHAGLIKRMQDGVKRVTALDVRIRVLEARNGARPAAAQRADSMAARKRVIEIYEKNKTIIKKQPPG